MTPNFSKPSYGNSGQEVKGESTTTMNSRITCGRAEADRRECHPEGKEKSRDDGEEDTPWYGEGLKTGHYQICFTNGH